MWLRIGATASRAPRATAALLLLLALFAFAKSRGLCVPPTITAKAGRSRKVQNFLTVDELKRFDAALVELAKLQPHRAIGYDAVAW